MTKRLTFRSKLGVHGFASVEPGLLAVLLFNDASARKAHSTMRPFLTLPVAKLGAGTIADSFCGEPLWREE